MELWYVCIGLIISHRLYLSAIQILCFVVCNIFSFERMIMIEKSFERQHNLAVAARVKMVLRLFNELKLYCPKGWCHQHETIIMNSHYISGLFFHSLNKERLLCTVFLFVTRNCGHCFYRHCHHNYSSVFGLNDYSLHVDQKHHIFTIVFSQNFFEILNIVSII